MAEKWTRTQFEDYYNRGDRSWLQQERLSIECHEAGCDDERCHGWKMTHLDWLEDDKLLYGNTYEEVQAALHHRAELLASRYPRVRRVLEREGVTFDENGIAFGVWKLRSRGTDA